MASSAALSIVGAGAGTWFSGERNLSPGPRKHFLWLSLPGKHSLHYKCFRLIPRTKGFIFALGKEAEDSFLSNMNEDTDDMFDDLFNKYGKVVFRRTDQKPPTAEVDDDAESLAFAVAMAKVASEVKAADIKVLFEKPFVYGNRFFIIATAGVNQMVEREGDGRNYQLSRKAQKGKGAYGGANMTHKHRQNEKSQAMRPSNFSFSISISCISFWVLIIFGFAYFSP
ncbi:protein Iojap, chloroplastic [Carica papaya]|uniref:protein Iojap, chloroplastic n=1 Tax=Carica papaya TaxID=3649 RepID=UPI000B8CE7F9|nr:protein Iojap, chloroplastic [Carica papaya]